MTHKELAQLVRETQNNNTEAFAQLYSHFAQSVYYLALRILKNPDDANDVVQETFTKLYHSIDRLKKPRAITKYVNTIAYNTAISSLRQDKKDLMYDDTDLDNFMPTESKDYIPEKALEEKEKSEHIVDMVDKLTLNQRIVVTLFYYEDMSASEISEILGISEQAVNSRLFRARQTLKEQLEESKYLGVITMKATDSVLRKSLKENAADVFSKESYADNWRAIGENLDFSGKEISHSLEKLLQEQAKASVPPAVNRPQIPFFKIGVAALGIGLLSGALYLYLNRETPLPAPKVEETVVSTMPEKEPEPPVEVSEPEPIPEPEPEVSETPEPESAAPVLEPEPEPKPIEPELAIVINNSAPLIYERNQQVSKSKVVEDAGITTSDGASIVFQHWDKVDFTTSGEYGVYVYATDGEEKTAPVAVIIVIE